jgi:ABC-type glycerol-3-phosphate transport system substrate-binding protein
MIRSRLFKFIICFTISLFIFTDIYPGAYATDSTGIIKKASVPSAIIIGNYSDYRMQHNSALRPDRPIIVSGRSYDREKSSGVSIIDNLDGKGEGIITTGESSSVTYRITVKTPGLYNIEIDYYPLEGKGNPIEREILINGAIPFSEASSIVFQRLWQNAQAVVKDGKGNEFKPEQNEKQVWMTGQFTDNQGYYDEPFLFYLKEGENTITLNAVNEPMAISKIRLFKKIQPSGYMDVLSKWDVMGYKDVAKNVKIELQGEDAKYKSDPTLYPFNDRSSPITIPNSLATVKLNTIGGINWSNPRQRLTWEFTVENAGLYKINLRCKQNYLDDSISTRSFYIDGEIPFTEAKQIEVGYDDAWQIVTPGNKTPYKFYLSAGNHTISLENNLGYLTDILIEVGEIVKNLNSITRKIRMVVGLYPDPNRDYFIEQQIPECMGIFKTESARLKKIADIVAGKSGGKGSNYITFQKLFLQLDKFAGDSSTIPTSLGSFETNISGVANFILSATKQPLLLDYIQISSPESAVPTANESFLQKAGYEFRSFINSFFSDYNNLGSADSKDKNITLWLNTGRDQAQVIKDMIDNSFTSKKKIGVDVRLVNNDVLLPAVAVGKGPDVALGQDRSMPVNYGIRNAIYDLNNFSDIDEILKRFDKSSYVNFALNGHLYALPETQTFMMMFYRKDILDELGIELPRTWEELYSILFQLHKNYYDIGLPNITEDTIETYLMFLYQSKGQFYNDEESETLVNTKKGLNAFEKWTDLYTKYKITQKMNAFNRFRTGEAPIVIAPVTFYNQLVISAPEIKGMWDVAKILGTMQDDGSIDCSEVGSTTGAVIFKNTRQPDKSWEFLKWWTSKEMQVKYSREMEILQGPSGRVPTANLEAFSELSWPARTMKTMNEQRAYVKGLPELPGSYVVGRYLCTALRYSVGTGGDPRGILYEWNKKINNEIKARRQEFNMNLGG